MPCTPITPTVSSSSSASLSIVMAGQFANQGVTYSQFLQSLGTYNYGAEFFYLSGASFQQIGQPILYNHFDSNGNSVSTVLPFTVDPYQAQPSTYYEVESDQIILTGLSSLNFLFFKNSTLLFKFFATIVYLGNELDDKGFFMGDNAFEDFESEQGLNFFQDYCNYLIDKD
jgi:hypothetical protein